MLRTALRIFKVVGIAVVAFIGLMLFFWIMEVVFGQDATSRISRDVGSLVTVFVAVSLVAIVVGLFQKKK